MLPQMVQVGYHDEMILRATECHVEKPARVGGESGTRVEVAGILARSGSGVENDDRTLAALEPMYRVDQSLVFIAEAVFQAGLQRPDLSPVWSDDGKPIGGVMTTRYLRCLPFPARKHVLVLQASNELMDHCLVHSVGPLVGTRDTLPRGVDEYQRGIDQRIGGNPAAVAAPRLQRRVGICDGVHEVAYRLAHTVLRIKRYQSRIGT